MKTATTTWTAEGYWNTVMGASRSAADVVREFDLRSSGRGETDDRRGLDEWLATCEVEAASAGAGGDAAKSKALIEEWAQFRDAALDALCAALQTVTTEQIKGLRSEAAEAGDSKQVELCDAALAGDWASRTACERAILNAQAQVES